MWGFCDRRVRLGARRGCKAVGKEKKSGLLGMPGCLGDGVGPGEHVVVRGRGLTCGLPRSLTAHVLSHAPPLLCCLSLPAPFSVPPSSSRPAFPSRPALSRASASPLLSRPALSSHLVPFLSRFLAANRQTELALSSSRELEASRWPVGRRRKAATRAAASGRSGSRRGRAGAAATPADMRRVS